MSAWDIFVQQFVANGGYKTVLTGLSNTVIIAVFGLILGFIIGSLIAVIKVVPAYKNPVIIVLQRIGDVYVTVFAVRLWSFSC